MKSLGLRTGDHHRSAPPVAVRRLTVNRHTPDGPRLTTVGKGTRNRQARARQCQERHVATATDAVFARLLEPLGSDGFVALVEEHPELLSDASIHQMRRYSEQPQVGAAFRLAARLLRDARLDPASAWLAYRRAMDRLDKINEALADELEAVDAALDERQADDAIATANAALPRARDAGLNTMIGALLSRRGHAYLQRTAGDRATNQERSIVDFEAALDIVMDPDTASAVLMHLAIVYAERLRGDPNDNRTRAAALLRQALENVPPADPERRAIIETNLAATLLRQNDGDDAANAREATALCRSALRHRSPARDPDDWAYTILNLAPAVERLAKLGEADLDDARVLYQDVIEHRDAIRAPWLAGAAYQGLGRLELTASWRDPERIIDENAAGRFEEYMDNRAELRRARAAFEQARAITRDAPDQTVHGGVLAGLADVLAQLGEAGEALDAGRAALEILQPDTAPQACATVAVTVAALLAESGRWEQAADAYRVAVEAAELALNSYRDPRARAREIRELGATPRWAAFALARVGELREAAVVLDTGRTRELRRRFGLGAAVADADLAAACEPDWPIMYVNPTPRGTMLLLVASDAGGDLTTRARILDEPTSTDVYMRLIAGDESSGGGHSYLLSAGGGGRPVTDEEFRGALDEVLPWVGEALARPARALLAEHGATGVTLVLSGPVAAVPLHAAPWDEGGRARCLVDDLGVRFAPSSAVAATALRRATERHSSSPTLVGLADPKGNLAAAAPEISEIARTFAAGDVTLAIRRDATVGFLQAKAAGADYLHLACHARGGLFDSADAAVELADDTVSAFDLTELPALTTRLVAISACQSALSEIAGTPDEVVSIGTAMVAAGSACAIASLWSVDDAATALLMVRVYDETRRNGRRPPEALRRAQLWLRALTTADEDAFLAAHPALRAEFRRRAAAGDAPGRRGAAGAPTQTVRPYVHPDMWAPFIAVGA